ncbi:hypothetical protein TIFTF001_018566 [Ficus carica]|uniref:Uncharacterized protein n=1 Tax=Ficus carica TaxID=3494 RepID=A0AA88ACQ7_FICCA|nr:hypothetical protein TIFTF001_018566 [Ficus carica]
MGSCCCWVRSVQLHLLSPFQSHRRQSRRIGFSHSSAPGVGGHRRSRIRIYCNSDEPTRREPTGIQLYSEIERLLTDTVKQSQDAWGDLRDWTEVEPHLSLPIVSFSSASPKCELPAFAIHSNNVFLLTTHSCKVLHSEVDFLTCILGVLVIATPYASGFDYFFIADEVQFKFDRCFRLLKDTVSDLPTFGIGHSLGSVIHLLIGSRYAVQRNGNVLMAFNNKEASSAIPLFSPVLVPMAQSIGPILSQITSSPTIRLGAEMTMKQLGNLSPPIMKQVLPLVEQLPPLYMDLVKGREDFTPKPEETRRLIKSYYGISRNLLVKFKDDTIDETSTLAQVLSSEAAISSMLDMSIRLLPGDHGLPLQQAIPDVPPAMADAVNRGSEFLANLSVGTPWENVAKEVRNTVGTDSGILRAEISKDIDVLVDVITSWMASNIGQKFLRP